MCDEDFAKQAGHWKVQRRMNMETASENSAGSPVGVERLVICKHWN